MKLRDHFGSAEVEAFIREKMSAYDTSRLEDFRLYAMRGAHYVRGRCSYPSKCPGGRKGFRIVAGANPSLAYPALLPCFIGTETLPSEPEVWYRPDGSKFVRMVRRWRYITEDVIFVDAREVLIQVAGHEAFHFLRRTKQVPGRNGNPDAEKFGLQWLREWRQRA